jgi:uncharacterized membrane protein HdeD (DUF308 family)
MADNGETASRTRHEQQWVLSADQEGSVGDLLAGLTSDLSTLFRQEIQLARAETTEKIAQMTQSIVWMAAGGMVAYAGFIGLLIAVIVGLAAFMPLWLSALIVGVLVIVIGAVLIQSGRSRLRQLSVVPERTIESIQEDAALVKEKIS